MKLDENVRRSEPDVGDNRVHGCENEGKLKSYTLVVSSADCWHQWDPDPGQHRTVDPPAGSVSGPGSHSFERPGRPCWPRRADGLWPGWCSQDPASSLWSPPTSYGPLGWALASLELAAGPPGKTGGRTGHWNIKGGIGVRPWRF